MIMKNQVGMIHFGKVQIFHNWMEHVMMTVSISFADAFIRFIVSIYKLLFFIGTVICLRCKKSTEEKNETF